LRDALEFVHEASSIDSSEPFPQETVDLLSRLVPGEFVSYSEWDLTGRPLVTMAVEQPAVPTPPDVEEARREYCSTYPLSIQLRTAETRALKISDFISLRQLHRLDYYDSVLRPFRIEHQMRLWLSAPREPAASSRSVAGAASATSVSPSGVCSSSCGRSSLRFATASSSGGRSSRATAQR
jgi:hypothetical protein